MGAVIYILGVRDSDGLTALVLKIDGVDGHVVLFDEGDFPWPIDLSPATHPPTGRLPVFDETATQRDVELTPSELLVDLLDAQSSLLPYTQAANPGCLAVAADVLRYDVSGNGALDLQTATAPSVALTPTIVRGAIVVDLDTVSVLDASASTIDPVSAASGSGLLAPAVNVASSVVLDATLVLRSISRNVALLTATAAVLDPSIDMGTLTVKPQRVGASASGLAADLFLTNANDHAVDVSPLVATVLAPSAIVMEPFDRLASLVGASTSTITPTSVATGGPPASPAAAAAPASVLAPAISGEGSRAPNLVDAASAVLVPAAIVRGATSRAVEVQSASTSALNPSISHAGALAPASAIALASAVLAPNIRRSVSPAIATTSTSVLAPTIVQALIITPAVLDAAATIITPDVESPLQLVHAAIVDAASEVLAPEFVGCNRSDLVIAPATLSCAAIASGGTPVHGSIDAHFALQVQLVTAIDFTEVHDVIPSCQQNQVGLSFDLQVMNSNRQPETLEGSSILAVWLRPPSGASKRKAGQVFGDPSNGVVRYTSEPGDLHEHGEWAIQVSATLRSGAQAWSVPQVFNVEPNLGPYQPTSVGNLVRASIEVLEPTILFS